MKRVRAIDAITHAGIVTIRDEVDLPDAIADAFIAGGQAVLVEPVKPAPATLKIRNSPKQSKSATQSSDDAAQEEVNEKAD